MAKSVPSTLPIQFRNFAIDPEQFVGRAASKEEGDTRTIDLSFSSEDAVVPRYFGNEVLDHSKAAVRMGRITDGAPLLLDHNQSRLIGVIETASIKGKRGLASVRFSESQLGEEVYRDVKAGIRRNVSVGYRVHAMQLDKSDKTGETYRITDWEPMEISIVAIGADATVGIGRSEEATREYPVQVIDAENKTKSDDTNMKRNLTFLEADKGDNPTSGAAVVDVVKERAAAVTSEQKRWNDITDIADFMKTKHNLDVSEDAKRHIRDNKTPAEFQDYVLRNAFNAKPVETTPGIGMEKKDVQRFSILNVVRSLANGRSIEGFEKEVCDAAAKQMGRSTSGAIIPDEVTQASARAQVERLFTRAQNVTTATAGGFLVQQEYGPMIEFLRNKTVLGQMGITILNGLVGDFSLPQQTGGATAYWVSEDGSITDSEATFANKVMKPRRLGAAIPFTMQMLAQSSISMENFVRNEIDITLALKKDLAGLHGSGVSGEPIGIANTAGINATVTYGGAATWADVVEHETGIAVDNADIGSMAFALSAATVGKWKTILKDSVAGAGYLISDAMTANGYPVNRTNQISGNISFFGVWSQLLLAIWAGREVTYDNITLAKTGKHQIIVNEFCDFLVRQPLAFNVSTDSAAA